MLRTNLPAPRRPSRSSVDRTARVRPDPEPACAVPHTAEPFAVLAYIQGSRHGSGHRSAATYDAACAEPCGLTPESNRSTIPPQPSSPQDVPSSSAATELRSALPPAPCAGARPTSVPHRSPTQRQTRTPDVSARITPPWLSNPTRPPPLISLRNRVESVVPKGGPT